MLEYDIIDISEGIGIKKTDISKKCNICHYWYFSDKNLKYEPHLCNGYHNLMQKAIDFNNVAIVSVEGKIKKTLMMLLLFLLNEESGSLQFFLLCIKNEWNNLLSKEQRCYT